MDKPTYSKPELLSHVPIKFETKVSGHPGHPKHPKHPHGGSEQGIFSSEGATSGTFPNQ
ncbi:MAG: hypothetical protein H7X86_09105 [Gorillibacterium sp.]|nr:hypothetical protein [Gorillibacterium sp.]